MGLRHRSNANKDPEKGDEKGGQPAQEGFQPKGNEYEDLLSYVDYEASKSSHKSDDDDSSPSHETYRPWYAPWKKLTRPSTKDADRKIPDEWLSTDIQKGLGSGDVEGRREGFGYNELTEKKQNQFLKVLGYFRGPVLYIMEIAVILAAGLRDWIDFGVIIGILAMNAAVGWYQERSAESIVEKLKAGIAMKATVVRDGKEQEIEARELVAGDVVVLEEGSTIPADAKIVADYSDKDGSKGRAALQKSEAMRKAKAAGRKQKPKGDNGGDGGDGDEDEDTHIGQSLCSVDQSAITGESLAVEKYIGETAYYTCGIKRGKCYGVVLCPAKMSFVGKTAALVQNSNDVGHFQKVLGGIGTALLVLVFVFIFAAWIGGFFRNINIATPGHNNLLLWALIFFIIGVPVGLPVVTTTTMAVGASYLARRKAIVQKLTAIESLAGVDVLCSDKTGTLTANKLSLNEPYLTEGVDADWFMTVAVLASSHNIKSLDPIDKVTVTALKDYPKAKEMLRSGWHTEKFSPFDPVSKRITAEVKDKDGKRFVCAKGAPNAILKLTSFPPDIVQGYRKQSMDFAKRGFRSLGVAVKEGEQDWKLLGIMSMSDPPRSDTRATIHEAVKLGISVKMLTGDAQAISKETCRALGLGQNIFDSQQLMGGSMSGSDISDFVEAADGFAEVYPEHKYQVVEILQRRGHLTAMTGDGVNDAPSLKKADCGIAVEGASDAARSAADVVFLDEGLSTIITAIKVARQIFHRMKAYIIYRIALCVHLEVYILLTILILDEIIRAELVVFLAIFADLATLAIAYDRAPYASKPVEWQLPKLWILSTLMGLLLAGGTWIVRGTLFLNNGGIIENFGNVQEVIFLEVALTESWTILITRSYQGPDEAFVWPSWQLVGAILGVDILASLFCIFGWLSGQPAGSRRETSIVTVVKIWAWSFGLIIIIAFIYYIVSQFQWLDNIGKQHVPSKNAALENFLHELKRLTITHEQAGDDNGADIYKIGKGGKSPAEGKSQHPEAHKKEQDEMAKTQAGQSGSAVSTKKEKPDGKGEEATSKEAGKMTDEASSDHDQKQSSGSSDGTKLDSPDTSESGH